MRDHAMPFLLTLLVAWLATDLLIPWVTRLAHHFGRVDTPDARKVHTVPIPRLGGIAIFAGFLVAVAAIELLEPGPVFPRTGPFMGLLVGAAMIFMLGIADDLKPLPARFKLVVQIFAAAVAFWLGVRIEVLSNPAGGVMILPMWVSMGLTVFWLVGITNTVNLIDGLDGLAGGVSLIAASTTAVIALQTKQPALALLALALVGSTVGFLRYNWNPAKIFMGDSGSLFLGFTLAAISVVGLLKVAATAAVLVPVLILGVPIFDTAFAIVRRALQRRPIFSPDRGHLHHRLLGLGFSQRRAVVVIYAFCLLLGGTALVLLGFYEGVAGILTGCGILIWAFSSHFVRSPKVTTEEP
ncbi:MAG: MraY family glycosyltransferase [Candidatus Sericytochromatia bacterium]|nr:MraY family glycosyltransferase [Candidatus Sericytochromatia bacterium]